MIWKYKLDVVIFILLFLEIRNCVVRFSILKHLVWCQRLFMKRKYQHY